MLHHFQNNLVYLFVPSIDLNTQYDFLVRLRWLTPEVLIEGSHFYDILLENL